VTQILEHEHCDAHMWVRSAAVKWGHAIWISLVPFSVRVGETPCLSIQEAEIASDQRAANVARSGDADQPGGCGAGAGHVVEAGEAPVLDAPNGKLLASIVATTLCDLRGSPPILPTEAPPRCRRRKWRPARARARRSSMIARRSASLQDEV
jgi:hypothetical protein